MKRPVTLIQGLSHHLGRVDCPEILQNNEYDSCQEELPVLPKVLVQIANDNIIRQKVSWRPKNNLTLRRRFLVRLDKVN